jgi:hypothetical protein
MKQNLKSIGATLITLCAILSLTFLIPVQLHGQAGTGSLGQRYVDYKTSIVDFGTFKVTSGAVTGTGSLTGHVSIPISSADILALYSAPKLLIASPGAGHSITILKANFAITRTATVYVTGGGAAIIQYGSTTHGGGTQACDSTIAATVITGTAGLSNTFRNGAIISDATTTVDDKGIYLSAATGDFTSGTGTAVMDVWYTTN